MAEDPTIAVVGLGYVGLPLAVEFARLYKTIGIDQSSEKIAAYREFCDPAGKVDEAEFRAADKLVYTTGMDCLAKADVIIVAVPAPKPPGCPHIVNPRGPRALTLFRDSASNDRQTDHKNTVVGQ